MNIENHKNKTTIILKTLNGLVKFLKNLVAPFPPNLQCHGLFSVRMILIAITSDTYL